MNHKVKIKCFNHLKIMLAKKSWFCLHFRIQEELKLMNSRIAVFHYGSCWIVDQKSMNKAFKLMVIKVQVMHHLLYIATKAREISIRMVTVLAIILTTTWILSPVVTFTQMIHNFLHHLTWIYKSIKGPSVAITERICRGVLKELCLEMICLHYSMA